LATVTAGYFFFGGLTTTSTGGSSIGSAVWDRASSAGKNANTKAAIEAQPELLPRGESVEGEMDCAGAVPRPLQVILSPVPTSADRFVGFRA
jgi:hypothetical protein